MVKNIFRTKMKSKAGGVWRDLVAIADRHNQLKDWAHAAQYYREALKLERNFPLVWIQLGHMEKESGNAAEARLAYETAISINPIDTDARLHLAHLVKNQGDLVRAYCLFKEIYDINHDSEIEDELRKLIGTSKPYDAFMSALNESFDAEFYLQNNPDVAASGVDPQHHFIIYGWKERRKAVASQSDFSGDPFKNRPVSAGHRVALSVVMPTFNRGELLARTLRRLLDIVRDDPVEIVVVDDGSTDSTPDVLADLAFRNPHLRYISVANSGPGRARNLGAAESHGEVILFVGDDTQPVNSDLFRAHYQAHLINKDLGHAVLGKITWPDDKSAMPNAVMSLIQGDGQQQFGYKFMKPWQKYSPWLFYTANVSVKRNIVSDWNSEGFDHDFTLYGFEDSEFAYRMSKKYGNFGVYYTPNAIVEHHHNYNVAGFIRRQVACGMMIEVLLRKHPELEKLILGPDLPAILRTEYKANEVVSPTHYYSTMVEGIRAWALVIDHHYGLGSQNWHFDFLSAVFRLSLLDSYIMLQGGNPTAQAAAYRFLLTDFRMHMGRAVSTELLGDTNFANLL
jgi:glycosyltransferase involved in cell wall biosynthesis